MYYSKASGYYPKLFKPKLPEYYSKSFIALFQDIKALFQHIHVLLQLPRVLLRKLQGAIQNLQNTCLSLLLLLFLGGPP